MPLAHVPARLAVDPGGNAADLAWSQVRSAICGEVNTPWTSQLDDEMADLPCLAHIVGDDTADVGLWFRGRRIHLVLSSTALHALAHGTSVPPRPWRQTVAIKDIQTCGYNHATGQVLVQPIGLDQAVAVAVAPLAGHHLVGLLRRLRQESDLEG